jgi:choline dehydrogenase
MAGVADVVVVGGGSAGCVLAARLSEDPTRTVLMIEAGPDHAGVAELPQDVLDASQPTVGHDWGYVSEPGAAGRCIALPRARLVGGCSSTNGCFAVRGSPADYDGWAGGVGMGEWSFEHLLPFFCRLEADADFDDPWHGREGPIPIRRPPPDEINPQQRAFIEAAVTVGVPYVADHNRPGAVGVGPTPRNVRDGVRMSTALTYLSEARRRPNLVIRADALVDRIEVRHGRVVGVRLIGGEVVAAGAVVLAAGAYASPAILARSGIGPAGHLADIGIGVVVDLPGVGDNLIDHPLVAVDLPTTPGVSGPRFQAMATLHSQLAPADGAPVLHLFVAGPFDVGPDASPTGAVFGLVCGLMLPRSRGSVRLRSADPLAAPRIDVGHLRDPHDLIRLVEATILARRISRAEPLAGLVVGDELNPGSSIADDDRDAMAASITSRVESYHHPVGTCRMGTDPDAGAVVDPHGRVHGLDRLYVADASIMPTIPSANTNLPTIAVAERIAEWLRHG